MVYCLPTAIFRKETTPQSFYIQKEAQRIVSGKIAWGFKVFLF